VFVSEIVLTSPASMNVIDNFPACDLSGTLPI